MKHEVEINDVLIAKYLSGEATPEEAMALDDWLREPANRLHFAGVQQAWDATFPGKASRPVDSGKAWANVAGSGGGVLPKKAPLINLFEQKTIFKIAASIVFILIFGGVLYLNFVREKPIEIAVESQNSLQQIKFPDHSVAILNRNSSLVYPQAFGNTQRDVRLIKGEAFFNIAADASKPFIIRTALASIKVIGTSFNVILKSGTLEVSVDQGKVLVYSATDSVYLSAGDGALLKAGESDFNLHQSNSNVWAYATHKFVFNNTSLRDVFNYVEKAQGCTIRLGNEDIGNCKLTATFESLSTDYMLTLISEALNLTVTKNDDSTFTVEGEGCH